MATMVKEKRKEKKKAKDKSLLKSTAVHELPIDATETPLCEKISENVIHIAENTKSLDNNTDIKEGSECHIEVASSSTILINTGQGPLLEFQKTAVEAITKSSNSREIESVIINEQFVDTKQVRNSNIPNYKDLSNKLERMVLTENVTEILQGRQLETVESDESSGILNLVFEDVTPSAPCFEEIPQQKILSSYEIAIESKPKVCCTPIEDVIQLFSSGEMEDVRAMSEREEEIVETGPISGPEHPLVDLISTFRSSLMAVDRERIQLASGFVDEERSRNRLWKINKENVHLSEKCTCGLSVELRATYEHAELVRERLPAAKMRLEALLRDTQDSYCHHQHAALLAYYQIEELISETIESGNKSIIREALSLILVALRSSTSAPDALASALQRWAAALATALVDHRDLRQLLFILHHLFKQSRSVSWASRVVQVRVDIESPARVLALLELLLARPRIDNAQECTEESDEAWEEIDKHGDSGAVIEGTLREKDLLSLLYALPLRDLVARILLFKHNDIKQARPHEWGDNNAGRGVLRACFGIRTLLHVLRRATSTHATYARLREALREIAATALHSLACLHITSSHSYAPDLEDKVWSELEAVFFEGVDLFESRDLHKLPSSLLMDETAKNYCLSYIEQLHETAELSCNDRIRIVAQAAVDRSMDHELARIIIEFLLQTGLRRKTHCKSLCDETARQSISRLLAAHPYLHTIALHILADMNMVESIEASCVKILEVQSWRPSTGEVRALLDDWARRCPQLLQHLLLQLDYTPHTGVSLDVQLTIGSWVCSYVRVTSSTGTVPECWWSLLRRLRTHRSSWLMPLDAPPPDEEPTDLFSIAYALLSSSWGHCIPLICSEGVSAVCKLSAQRARDAVHCLCGIMVVMAQSPESVAFTPKFTEVFSNLLNWGPSLVARALGRGGTTGAELLLRLVLTQLDTDLCDHASVLSAWLHALWRVDLPASALGIVDTLACHTRLWPQLDAYANVLLQEEISKEHINHAIRNASTAPLLCECLLRANHGRYEAGPQCGHGRLLTALHQQRVQRQKIHVDNAIQKVNAKLSSEDLTIYRVCSAALIAPLGHPSHLTLWRLLLHIYLQRAPEYTSSETIPPVGPLFFSGLIKSRTLGNIKKRLQESITYHHNEAELLKSNQSIDSNQPQSIKNVTKSNSGIIDGNLLPALTIVDLTGEQNSLSDSEGNEEDIESLQREQSPSQSSIDKRNILSLVSYHKAAEKMLGEYLIWLEQGDNVRAMPHHADIARFIPEHALEAAWKRAVSRPAPSEDLDNFPVPKSRPPADMSPPNTPFHKAVSNIMKIKDHSRKRYKTNRIKSPVAEVDYRDARALITLVDKHLKDIEILAHEWCTEVSRISSLDTKLWQLVAALRVSRPIPPVRKQCINKCPTITFTIPAREWCLSVDAAHGIKENRSAARTALRRLARARPAAARTAAALHTIARRIRSSEVSVRVVERAWRSAGVPACGECAPARTVLTALVTQLCERWICSNGQKCSDLLSDWGKQNSNTLQQSLCSCLVSPRQLSTKDWPRLYTALLDSNLPPHAVFSYLSKFEMSRWSESAEASEREEILCALVRCIQRAGPSPHEERRVLTEMLSVHAACLMTSKLLPAHIKQCARLSIQNTLPYSHWSHVIQAVLTKADGVPFDQLGHLLRELGIMWWEVRTSNNPTTNFTLVTYAPYIASLLHALQRTFVAAAIKLSYEPERVALYAWSSLQESWSAWISPHPTSLPLLPSTADNEQYTSMVRYFIDCVHQVMLDCPGTEIYLLQQIFEWSVQVYASVHSVLSATVPSCVQESQVQRSALLAELAKLPWTEHQWFYGKSLQVALQVCTCNERELTTWCCTRWSNTKAETLLYDVGDQLVPRLASLLYLFTGTLLTHSQQVLEEAYKIPWWRLPERALDEALDRFFAVHHNVAQPYHDLPQFRIMMMACELSPVVGGSCAQLSVSSRTKRAVGVSQWVRAATSPPLLPHVTSHTTCLLDTLANISADISRSEGELEELLSRAVVIMCIEPAATVALPVWVSYISRADVRLCLACVSAAVSLTAFEYCGSLGDAAIKAAVNCAQSNTNWNELGSRWSRCAWQEPAPLVGRVRLHAAYTCALALPPSHAALSAALQALLAPQIHFIDNEPIVAVWICFALRLLRASDSHEVTISVRSLLSRWAEQEKRSLLSRVTMSTNTDQPTAIHRVLCRYALYILNPDTNTRRSFETSYVSAVGSNSDVETWTVTPRHDELVNLAIRLLNKYHYYFQYELQNV